LTEQTTNQIFELINMTLDSTKYLENGEHESSETLMGGMQSIYWSIGDLVGSESTIKSSFLFVKAYSKLLYFSHLSFVINMLPKMIKKPQKALKWNL